MKVLVSGFDPFGGEPVNPAWEAVRSLPDRIENIEIYKVQLPTVFKKSYLKLFAEIDEYQPDAVICVGQAGGRYEFSVERVAINVDDGRIPDNEGNQPIDSEIFHDGENAYFSRLPIKTITEKLLEANIPASVSNTAGTYVCNHIMYALLYYLAQKDMRIPGGFVHVPFLPQQVLDKKNAPYMSLDMIREALKIVITTTCKATEIRMAGGKEF